MGPNVNNHNLNGDSIRFEADLDDHCQLFNWESQTKRNRKIKQLLLMQ